MPGGALNFFSGRGVRPRFPKCGACELAFASEKGGLWAENFQIWGLVSWKFPNLGACELKIPKFGGLWAKILVKNEAVEAKISKFSQKGVLWTDSFAWNGTLASGRRGVKRGSSGPHIPIPLSRSVPPPGKSCKFSLFYVIFGLFWGYISHPAPLVPPFRSRPPPFYISWIRPCSMGDISMMMWRLLW